MMKMNGVGPVILMLQARPHKPEAEGKCDSITLGCHLRVLLRHCSTFPSYWWWKLIHHVYRWLLLSGWKLMQYQIRSFDHRGKVPNFCCRYGVPIEIQGIDIRSRRNFKTVFKQLRLLLVFWKSVHCLSIISLTEWLRGSIGHLNSICQRLLTRSRQIGTSLYCYFLLHIGYQYTTQPACCLLYTSRCV